MWRSASVSLSYCGSETHGRAIMKTGAVCILAVSLLGSLWLTGCGGGDGGGSSAGNTNTNSPSALAGKTYTFTVTARQGLTEPVGSTYSIAFTDSSMFTFNPSPQNIKRTNSRSGQ